MASKRRAKGAGMVYLKHGCYYGRWYTAAGGRANRKLGPARKPGTSQGLTRAQAEKRLREAMSAVAVTTDPDRTVATLGDALLAQLETRGRARSHIETVESHLRVHIRPFFGNRPVDRIGEEHVTRFLARLRRSGLAAKTVRNVASTLHSAFELAIRRRWIVENPCRLVELPAARPNAEIRYLTQDELVSMLQQGVPTGRLQTLDRALYLTAAMTGMRMGELLALRWEDVDFDAQKIRVRQAYVRGEFKGPKSTRGSRGVPMASEVAMALETLRKLFEPSDEADLVFGDPDTGEPMDRNNVRRRFQRACRRAGVRAVRFHDLRHTFGTRVAASGEVSLRTLQEWMGHRDAKTTLIYADYQPGDHEAAMVSRAFGARGALETPKDR